MTDAVQRAQDDGRWEKIMGSSRAVAAGDRVSVAGMLPYSGDELMGEGDAREQTAVAFGNALAQLREFGLGPEAVIRTRTYLTHARDVDAACFAHREIFGTVRPAATVVIVTGFVDSRVLVEVEVEAYRGTTGV
ncbi:Rid family hydrolase [Kitasatospora sp. NPDC005856]|uniref:Rid family hydrolase n=1 Tax=Kitasatospora sp. NPDC005856 TaxID=3154566 RepID=UPI0033CBFF79